MREERGEMDWSGQGGSEWIGRGGGPFAIATHLGDTSGGREVSELLIDLID